MKLPLLLAQLGLALATIALLAAEHKRPNAGLPLVTSSFRGGHAQADFSVCVMVKPDPPLLRSPKDRLEYRPGQTFNDKGVS